MPLFGLAELSRKQVHDFTEFFLFQERVSIIDEIVGTGIGGDELVQLCYQPFKVRPAVGTITLRLDIEQGILAELLTQRVYSDEHFAAVLLTQCVELIEQSFVGLPSGIGIFILPGKKGLGGRGRWLLIAGMAIPLVYLVLVVWR